MFITSSISGLEIKKISGRDKKQGVIDKNLTFQRDIVVFYGICLLGLMYLSKNFKNKKMR